jgi:hypothetical protein
MKLAVTNNGSPLNSNAIKIAIREEDQQEINKLVLKTSQFLAVGNAIEAKFAAEILKEVKALRKQLDSSRDEVKTPFREIGKEIDKVAKDADAPLAAEQERIDKLSSDYIERENARIAAERAAEEKIRQARIREEQQKLAALEAERRQAEESTRQAKNELEAAQHRARQADLFAQEEARRKLAAENAANDAVAAALKPTTTTVEGASVRYNIDLELIDWTLIPRLLQKRLLRVELDKPAVKKFLSELDVEELPQIPGIKVTKRPAII